MCLSSAESGREVPVQMEIGEFLTKLVGESEKFAGAAGQKGDFDQENHELAAVEAVRDLAVLVKPNVLYGEKINEDGICSHCFCV